MDDLLLTAYRLKPAPLRIVPAPADRYWMDTSTEGWANRCLPLRVANQAGWWILNNCDFEATWTGSPQVEAVQIRFLDQASPRYVKSNFGYGILTWDIPYLFRTPPGYNLLARGPANLWKDGAMPLEGLVETDWAVASFTMNWKLTRPQKAVKFEKDEPICMIVPQRRGELESFAAETRNIESTPALEKGFLAWRDSRRAFAAEQATKPPQASPPWQGHYTRGNAPGGESAPEHQTKLKLREFEEKEAPPLASAEDTRGPSPPQRPSSWWDRWRSR